MQTFLPETSFAGSAAILDGPRLRKQVLETKQILDCLLGIRTGYLNHPATQMWVNHHVALAVYGAWCWEEYRRRGGTKHLAAKECFDTVIATCGDISMPDWFLDPRVHESHRQSLLMKDPSYYSQYYEDHPTIRAYWWPSHNAFHATKFPRGKYLLWKSSQQQSSSASAPSPVT